MPGNLTYPRRARQTRRCPGFDRAYPPSGPGDTARARLSWRCFLGLTALVDVELLQYRRSPVSSCGTYSDVPRTPKLSQPSSRARASKTASETYPCDPSSRFDSRWGDLRFPICSVLTLGPCTMAPRESKVVLASARVASDVSGSYRVCKAFAWLVVPTSRT